MAPNHHRHPSRKDDGFVIIPSTSEFVFLFSVAQVEIKLKSLDINAELLACMHRHQRLTHDDLRASPETLYGILPSSRLRGGGSE